MNPEKKFNTAAIIILVLLLFSHSSLARSRDKEDPPWYQVEVVVFANKKQMGLASETWPDVYPKTRFQDIIDLAVYSEIPYTTVQPPVIEKKPKKRRRKSKNNQPELYTGPAKATQTIYARGAHVILGRSEYALGSVAQRVSQSGNYDLLLHIAWRQPTYGKAHSIPVFVFEGMRNPDQLVKTNTMDPNAALAQLPVGPDYHRLSGTFRLSVARYLHLEADLHYRVPMLQEETVYEDDGSGFGSFFGMQGSTPITREREVLRDFRLLESRRMRSKEIHYYDHPMLSIISKVIPYKFPEKDKLTQKSGSQ